MDYRAWLREKYREEDPWHFGSCLCERVRHATMAEFALANRPERVLDLGCGEGHFLAYLLDRAPHLQATGVELEPTALKRAQRRLVGRGVRLAAVDVTDYLDQAKGSFDVVVCGDLLYYLSRETVATRVVPGVARLLRPAGRLVVSYADVNDHAWTVDVFRGPFEVLRQIYVKPLPPPPYPWVVALLQAVNRP